MFNVILIVFVMSWGLTWCVRRYALAKQIMDIPNQRSSHQIPTPRGGGIAFVFVFIIILACLIQLGVIHWSGSFLIIDAAGFIAFLGFFDDRWSLKASVRFIGHTAACALALYAMHGMPLVYLYHWTLQPNLLMTLLALFYLVWMVNLYNFMDGIDGIAGIEGVSVCLGIGLLYWCTGHRGEMLLPLLFATTLAGFLYWNLPPARIFMGDAGSGFIGFILGILSIKSASIHPDFLWCWLILLGVFIVDATVTLLFRLARGEKIYLAHRTHAYQHASISFKSHLSVTLSVLVINLLWLCPLAIFVGLGYINGLLGLFIAYLPLILLAMQFNAGKIAS